MLPIEKFNFQIKLVIFYQTEILEGNNLIYLRLEKYI